MCSVRVRIRPRNNQLYFALLSCLCERLLLKAEVNQYPSIDRVCVPATDEERRRCVILSHRAGSGVAHWCAGGVVNLLLLT